MRSPLSVRVSAPNCFFAVSDESTSAGLACCGGAAILPGRQHLEEFRQKILGHAPAITRPSNADRRSAQSLARAFRSRRARSSERFSRRATIARSPWRAKRSEPRCRTPGGCRRSAPPDARASGKADFGDRLRFSGSHLAILLPPRRSERAAAGFGAPVRRRANPFACTPSRIREMAANARRVPKPTRSRASYTSRAGGESAAGEALAIFPPIVPRFCVATAPVSEAARQSNGNSRSNVSLLRNSV